jgi:hypothetical protein
MFQLLNRKDVVEDKMSKSSEQNLKVRSATKEVITGKDREN